jgi:prophage maintenance system killer protein
MPDDPEPSLRDLLTRLQIILSQPVDFAATGAETTIVKVRLLTAAAVYFNVLSLSDFGGRAGAVRGEGLVEQAVGAAFQSFGGVDPHPDPFDKAAMLLRGITQGHPFSDGNKRTGFLLAAYYLRNMGYPWPMHLPEDQVIAFCLRVSAGSIRDVQEMAAALRQFWGASEVDP